MSNNSQPALAPPVSHPHPHPTRSRPPRILFFSRILPQPGTNGSGAYASDILDYFQRHGCEIRVLWTEIPGHFKYTFYNTLSRPPHSRLDIRPRDCHRIGSHVFNPRAIWLPRKARALYFLKRMLQRARIPLPVHRSPVSGVPIPKSHVVATPSWDTPCTSQERAFLLEHTSSFKPDILIANYPWMLAGLEKKNTARHHWVLTNDYRYRRCSLTPQGKFVEQILDVPGHTTEQSWLSPADLLVAIQENETAAYTRTYPGKDIVTACMSVPIVPMVPAPPTPICAFIGSDHAINQKSALWFVEHVWPLVLRNMSHARLRVAGRVCDALAKLKHRPRVELLGQIPSLRDFYAGASVVVVPILEGSGVKIKLLEAISHQRATVTTSVGLDGLEFLRPALGVADTPETFANAITRFLSNQAVRDRAAANAIDLARRHLHPDACYAPLLSRVHAAVSKH